eukprot:NODE_7704_length_552_cov_31.091451_g6672_i0.p6 GENE.NODE_7704_length_552_cov_31.091451_g6672_i0~~NODE_7704_length_552_cov_31.091451_g6672_i0.p6  ORF type:complete len:59 (+),score=8.56 NODE_7704_length_552_cov_31.091451_g6672_i0:278-454(+)
MGTRSLLLHQLQGMECAQLFHCIHRAHEAEMLHRIGHPMHVGQCTANAGARTPSDLRS